MAQAVVPRGQVPIPPELWQFLKDLYKAKGGITGFSKRSGVKSDTLRMAIKRGTTTEGTLKRIKAAAEKIGLPVLATKAQAARTGENGNGQGESAVQIEHLPPAVLRQIQRVSSALLDGMQLMQLTVLKALQEELGDGHGIPPRLGKLR